MRQVAGTNVGRNMDSALVPHRQPITLTVRWLYVPPVTAPDLVSLARPRIRLSQCQPCPTVAELLTVPVDNANKRAHMCAYKALVPSESR